jgi:hypothetical protein
MFWPLGFWLSCSGLLVIGYHVLASWLLAIMFWPLGYWLSCSDFLVIGYHVLASWLLAIMFWPLGFITPKYFYIISLSNISILSVPNEGYFRNAPRH